MRRVLVLCVIAAAALVAWWLLRDETPTTDVSAPPAPAVVPAPASPTRSAERVSRRATPSETPAAAAPAPARAVEKIAEADAGGTLLVVDLATGQALAGVHVWFLAVGAGEVSKQKDLPAASSPDADPMEEIAAHGRELVSDEKGNVLLPKFDGSAVVAARHGELRGTSLLAAGQPNQRLELHSAVALAALVVDADGRPCGGVGVFLRSGRYPLGYATTDAKDGVARLADAFANVSADHACGLAVAVALPLADGPSVVVDLKNPPAGPVRLVLPPCGRVRCEVVDEHGAAVSVVARLRRPAQEVPGGLVRIAASPLEDAKVVVADGVARFPYVGLGLQLEVEIASTDGSRVTARQQFAGPTAAGDETVVRVTVGGRRPAVVGRLADAKGSPIAGLALVAGIIEPGRPTDIDWGLRVECTTDAGGRFRFAFDRAAGDTASAKLEIGRRTGEHRVWPVRRIALVGLPAVLPAGDVDVGDVVYRGTGLLASGVVVDDEGAPLAGATIAAMELGRGAERSPLRDVNSVTSDSEGRFRLEGDPVGSFVHLGASLEGRFVSGRLGFAMGATDVRIVMSEAGGIAGSVRVPAGQDSRDVRILVAGGPENNGDTDYRFRDQGLWTWIDEDGKFDIRTLRPGQARVWVRLGRSEDDTVLAVDGVEVVAGQVTRDPRLQDVDLSKSLVTLKLLVRDADGKPVQGATVHFRPVGSRGFWEQGGTTASDGAADVQAKAGDVSRGGVDLAATCRGYRSALVRAAKSDAAIVLERGKPTVVTLRLASGSPLPDPPFQLGASLQWIEPGGSDDDTRWSDPRSIGGFGEIFGKDRVLTFETFDTGRWRVVLMLWETDMSGRGGSGIDSVPETVVVTVGPDGAPAEVFVGVDSEDLKRETSRKR